MLFTLGEGSSEEIEAVEEKLRSLQSSYRRAAASTPYYSYTSDSIRVEQAKQAYLAAEREMKAAKEAAEAVSSHYQVDKDLERKIENAEDELNQRIEDVKQKQKELNEAEGKDPDLEQQLAELREKLETLKQNSSPTPEMTDLQREIDDLVAEIASLQARVDNLESLKDERDRLSDDLKETLSEENKQKLNEQLEKVLQDIAEAETARDTTIPNLRTELNSKLQEYESAREAAGVSSEAEIADIESQIAALESSDVEKARKALEEAELLQEEASIKLAELKAQQEAMDGALENEGTPEANLYKLTKAARDEAYLTWQTLLESLQNEMASDARSAASTALELQDLNEQIEIAKKKLAELLGGEDAQITAKVAGTIQSIEATAGDTKQKGDILCTIEVPDMGYTLSFSVTNDQANRLRPGDTATVSNFYWGTEIVATLNSIKTDPKNPQTNKLLTFDLSGNVTAGTELTIAVGQKSANYDVIIPSSAIRSDANGSFVLKVEAKNSPLGNRYIARRVPVEVLASDDSNSAVTADLSYGDYVITTSNVPVKNGEQVRLANA